MLWHQPSQTDLLFITLNKSEALFSPSTHTRDLALGPSPPPPGSTPFATPGAAPGYCPAAWLPAMALTV